MSCPFKVHSSVLPRKRKDPTAYNCKDCPPLEVEAEIEIGFGQSQVALALRFRPIRHPPRPLELPAWCITSGELFRRVLLAGGYQ